MIYTGRYQYRLDDARHYAVRTTAGAPRFPLPYTLQGKLHPMVPMPHLRGQDSLSFRLGYFAQLERAGLERITSLMASLEREAGDRDVVLLCFCDVIGGKHEFCHRHLFSEWIERKTGLLVPEIRI